MLEDKLELLISSCDKYSDLWDLQVKHLNKYWDDRKIKSTIVTDCASEKEYPRINIFAAGLDLEMPQRLKYALENVSTEYVLLTLDDYFVIEKISNERINELVGIMDKHSIDYIRLFSVPKEKERYSIYSDLYWIDLNRNYAINLYPGIWRKSFLYDTLKESLNAWEYEVSLTNVAKKGNYRCLMSRGKDYVFVDVIRKGKLLRKASKYLKKNNLSLNRDIIPFREELKLNLMFYCKKYFPRSLQVIIKKTMEFLGMKFISKGI